jgi:hypothetical protein
MRKHLIAVLALSVLSAVGVSVGLATTGSGVSATPLARGAGGEFRIKDSWTSGRPEAMMRRGCELVQLAGGRAGAAPRSA